MAIHSSIFAGKSHDRGAWWAMVGNKECKESETTRAAEHTINVKGYKLQHGKCERRVGVQKCKALY